MQCIPAFKELDVPICMVFKLSTRGCSNEATRASLTAVKCCKQSPAISVIATVSLC